MLELTPTSMAHGGAAVGRVDGKAHFVDGAMPDELVRGTVVVDKGAWARVELDEVVIASPQRIDPPCRHFAECGGCQWQFADYPAQLEWKQSIVSSQLAHIAGLRDIRLDPIVAPGPAYGYRNRMDFSVLDGVPALSQRRSHTLVPIAECLLIDPSLTALSDQLVALDRVRGVTIRTSMATGEILAVIRGRVPEAAESWNCLVSRRDRTGVHPAIGNGAIHERVGGIDLRITGDAFFQNNTAGAEALVNLVRVALDPQPGETLLDAYAGGGLFAVTIGDGLRVIAVESNGLAVFDLRHNLERSGIDYEVIKDSFEDAVIADSWDIAIADPPREGLRAAGVAAITRGTPRAIVYVSCDPASLSRDARLLTEAGYDLDLATPVDLFPQTFHVETVARFSRR